MIRHQIARILSAIADRIEPDKPPVQIQYIYVSSPPPVVTPSVPQWTPQWPQSPWVSRPNPNICSVAPGPRY